MLGSGNIRLEMAPEREFVSWAFAEPQGYRSRALTDRMNGNRVYLRMGGAGLDLSGQAHKGRNPIVLDRAVLCGWRFVDGRGSPRTSWAVAVDRDAALKAAWSYCREMESYDRGAAPDYRDAATGAPVMADDEPAAQASGPSM